MTVLTRKRALYVAVESTYGTDPDSDGSSYLYVPCLELSDIKDEKAQLETRYYTGRAWQTAPIAGADGASFDFTVPLIGLIVAAGDGGTPNYAGWIEDLLSTMFNRATINGEGVAPASSTTSLVLDTDVSGIGSQSLVPVHESGLPTTGERTQWCYIATDNASATYTISNLDGSEAVTSAAVAYGTRTYSLDETTPANSSMSFCYLEDMDQSLEYTLSGCKITAMSLSAEVGQIAKLKFSVAADSKTLTTKSNQSLPTGDDIGPGVTPIKALLSGVWVDNVAYDVRSVAIDFGVQVATIEATAATNGRASMVQTTMEPTVSIEALRSDDFDELKRNATVSRLIMQFGAGVHVVGPPSVLNTVAISMGGVVATTADWSDDKGVSRNAVSFKVIDRGNYSGSALTRYLQIARA